MNDMLKARKASNTSRFLRCLPVNVVTLYLLTASIHLMNTEVAVDFETFSEDGQSRIFSCLCRFSFLFVIICPFSHHFCAMFDSKGAVKNLDTI